MNTRPVLALFAATLAALAGCKDDPIKAPYAGQQDPLPANQYPQITVEGPLSPYLAFDTPKVSRDSGTLKVVTGMRLQSDKNYESEVQFRYIFLDAGGRPLRAQPDWQQKRLPSRQQVFLEGVALDSTAADWRLEVRSAR